MIFTGIIDQTPLKSVSSPTKSLPLVHSAPHLNETVNEFTELVATVIRVKPEAKEEKQEIM